MAEVGQYSCTKPTTTEAVGGLGHARPMSRLLALTSKAWINKHLVKSQKIHTQNGESNIT
jgi:hypothetical protein